MHLAARMSSLLDGNDPDLGVDVQSLPWNARRHAAGLMPVKGPAGGPACVRDERRERNGDAAGERTGRRPQPIVNARRSAPCSLAPRRRRCRAGAKWLPWWVSRASANRVYLRVSNSEWAVSSSGRTRALSYGSRSAFMPIIALLRSYMGIRWAIQPAKSSDRVSQKLKEPTLTPGRRSRRCSAAGRDGIQRRVGSLDPQIKRERLLAALKRPVISREDQNSPVAVRGSALADVESQAMLDVLVDAIRRSAFCLS